MNPKTPAILALFASLLTIKSAAASEQYFSCSGFGKSPLTIKRDLPIIGKSRLFYLKAGEWAEFPVITQNEIAITVDGEGRKLSNQKAAERVSGKSVAPRSDDCANPEKNCQINIRFNFLKTSQVPSINYVILAASPCFRLEHDKSQLVCRALEKNSVLGEGDCRLSEPIK